MRDEIAELVYPVFRYGLDVKDQLDAGERIQMEKTRLDLIRLLSDKRWARLEGEAGAMGGGGMVTSASIRLPGGAAGGRGISGSPIRYALVCWVDELFISHSPWGLDWRDSALEIHFYNSNEAAWKFWEQAQRVEGQAGGDALEVYYLCAQLGFRGDYRQTPTDLQNWVDKVRPQIIRGYGEEPSPSDRSEPENYVPLLTGRDRFAEMLRWWGRTFFVCLFVFVVLLIASLER